MRNATALLLALFLAAVPHLGRSGQDSVGLTADTPLVRIRVPGNGAFFSLLPPTNAAPVPLVWTPERLAVWKTLVGNAVGARFVAVRPDNEPFPVQASNPTLADLLRPGLRGISAVPLPNGDVWTNRLVLVPSAGGADLHARLVDTSATRPGRLNPARGAGTNIWFVSWNDLKARWKSVDSRDQRLRDIDAIVSANPAAREFLDARRRNRPDLWSAIVFINDTATNVAVSCGDRTEKRLPPGERWTVEFKALPKSEPDENGVYSIPWSYLEDGTSEEILKPLRDRPLLWNPFATSRVTMRLTPRSKRDRVLDLRDILPPGWAENRPDAAGLFSVSLEHGGAVRPLPENAEDPWLRNLPPEVDPLSDFLAVSSNDFFRAAEFVPGPFSNRGDRACLPFLRPRHAASAPSLAFHSWPGLFLTNTTDRAVTNLVSFLADGTESAPVTNVLDEGAAVVVPGPAPDFAPFATTVVARVASSAAWAAPFTAELPLCRRAVAPTFALSPDAWIGWNPRPSPPWPDDKHCNDIPATLFGVFAAESRARNIGYEPDVSVEDVFQGACGETLGQIRSHLAECTLRECPRCGPFRHTLAEIGSADPRSPDPVDIVLALCPEYLRAKRKRDPEAEMQKARDRLQPYRGQESPAP